MNIDNAEVDVRHLLHAPPLPRLDGKVAWITGASRGLGRALAFALAGAGAELLLSARDAVALDEVAGAVRAAGGVAHPLAGSVADADAVAAAAAYAERTWGRLDVLVNNAGISPSYDRAERVADDVWEQVLDVNLSGPFRCCKAALPLLEAAGGGSVVNISSVHGHAAHKRVSAYAASKGGLELLTRTLALEWAARGVRVNSVAPGYLATDMTSDLRDHDYLREELLRRTPLGRFGELAEVAAAVLFLASPAAGYVTGSTLFVDGGWTAQ